MNALSLAFASAGAALAFEGPYCAISACAFALSAVAFSFVRKKACVAVIACGGAALYLYFLFTLYGAAVSFTFTAFAALSCFAEKEGVTGAGALLAVLSVPFLLAMPFIPGNLMPAAPAAFMPLSLAAGICAERICGARPGAAFAACYAGGAAGCFVRACGGVCAELVTYSGLFFLALVFSRGIISRGGRA